MQETGRSCGGGSRGEDPDGGHRRSRDRDCGRMPDALWFHRDFRPGAHRGSHARSAFAAAVSGAVLAGMIRAGTPTAVAPAGTSRSTTALAPTRA